MKITTIEELIIFLKKRYKKYTFYNRICHNINCYEELIVLNEEKIEKFCIARHYYGKEIEIQFFKSFNALIEFLDKEFLTKK